MLNEERRRKIVELLQRDGRVVVKNLARRFSTSFITIRKDLDQLHQQGLLQRAHGGALPLNTEALRDPSFREKERLHQKEKARIAAAAVRLVKPGQVVILDSGTTTSAIAHATKHVRNLTVITNAVNIASDLVGTEVEAILTGGTLRKNSFSLVGPLAEESLRHVTADLLFLAVDGFDVERGLTTPQLTRSQSKPDNDGELKNHCCRVRFQQIWTAQPFTDCAHVERASSDHGRRDNAEAVARPSRRRRESFGRLTPLEANLNSKAGVKTIAEILSEPDTWKRCLSALDESGQLRTLNEALPKNVEWVFVGCGTSYYLAQIAAATWSLLTTERARAIPASEIMLFPGLFPKPCQPVIISRSGHTSEAVAVARYLEEQLSIKTLAITCSTATAIEKVSTHLIRLPHADEQSVVMTRSLTSMLLALQSLAAERAGRADFLQGLRSLPAQMEQQLANVHTAIRSLVESREFADYVFLGQGPFFGVSQEAMLKVTEMSCSYAQSFHTLEFRHGPKAIVSRDTLVTFFLSESGFDAETAMLEEVKGLGGTTLVITNKTNSAVRKSADYLIDLSLDVPEAARPAAAIIPGQLLGFHTGIRKGIDPDQPRNLSRFVNLATGNSGGR